MAPLLGGGAQAITQLGQNNYVGALLTTGTASAMTLMLIGTVSVGTILVQRVAQNCVQTQSHPPSATPAAAARRRSAGA